MLRVLHTVASLHPRHGGSSSFVAALTDALAGCAGIEVALWSQGAANAPVVPPATPQVVRRVAVGRSWLDLALGLPLKRALLRLGRQGSGALPVDLLHSHGLWHPANHWSARAARDWGVPLVLHVHGMLEPWALARKAWKKRLALALFQRADLDIAAALVATSGMEYEHLRRLGLRLPIAVIPNGIAFPGCDTVTQPAPRPPDRVRNVLFLSRVHPKKGVLELVSAWGQAAPVGWRLCIAGPDEGGHWREVERRIQQLGISASIDYIGSVEGERKAALYRDADLFVLPTFSENFGLVVAEALAYGVPVITTRGAPWADLETYGCGWWIETGVAPLVAALRAAMALSDAERAAMGARGRVYVRRYDWDAIAAETVALYRWVLGQGERPGCVRID